MTSGKRPHVIIIDEVTPLMTEEFHLALSKWLFDSTVVGDSDQLPPSTDNYTLHKKLGPKSKSLPYYHHRRKF